MDAETRNKLKAAAVSVTDPPTADRDALAWLVHAVSAALGTATDRGYGELAEKARAVGSAWLLWTSDQLAAQGVEVEVAENGWTWTKLEQSAWEDLVRIELAELSSARAARWVEGEVEGFADWFSDRLSPREAAEAALVDATGYADLETAAHAADDEAGESG